jgi:hypothetical protein
VRLGLIARADDRGLGIQSWELYRHLQPAKVLIADLSHRVHYPIYPERFPGALISRFEGDELDSEIIHQFLHDLDVVLTCETPYDYRIYDIARRRGIRTACQFNYEFFKYLEVPSLPKPDLFIAPSTWHLERLRRYEHVLLPLGVDRERCRFRHRKRADVFLHPGGHRAWGDRNGTEIVRKSLRYIKAPVTVRIRTQSRLASDPHIPKRTDSARVEVIHATESNYWDVYDGDVLVLPRRYGGQCLPLNEALSCGLVPVMPDIAPQSEFLPPECLIRARVVGPFRTQAGSVTRYAVRPVDLGYRLRELYEEPEIVSTLSKWADGYAETISWETMRSRWLEVLGQLAAS